MEILEGLNDKQKQAVETTEGYVRVVAGAGSGKTLTLTRRYEYLVEEVGIPTKNILCVTFTNKAANEMKKRIQSTVPGVETPYICTFHSFCVKVLREDIHVINYPQNFLILDEEDSTDILKTVYETMRITTSFMKYKDALCEIEKRKRKGEYVKYFSDLNNDMLKADIEKAKNGNLMDEIFLRYIYEEKKNFALDFGDLIFVTLEIFKNHEDKMEKWQKRMQYVMVDEFQDINKSQYDLVNILSDYHKNLFIVGDPDQNIYSWRGANVSFIMDFNKLHPDSTTIILDENYRSTNNVLNASNSLIDKNADRIKKSMFTKSKKDIPVIHNSFKNDRDEATWVISKIREIKAQTGCNYNDFAVLYRAHYVSRVLEEALLKADIPYQIYSGVSFYQRKEIKDVLAYLRMLTTKDDFSFKRTVNNPTRGFGEKRIRFLTNYAVDHNCSLWNALLDNLNMGEPSIKKSGVTQYVDLIEQYSETYQSYRVSDLVDEILKKTGYEEQLRALGDTDRLDNIAELKKSIFEMEQKEGEFLDLTTYLQDISLFTNAEKIENKDCVQLMTAHSAKGLEWENVFLFELNEKVFPSARVKNKNELEEERRLCYVGMTRAKSRLFMTSSYGTTGRGEACEPSRFLYDIDKGLVHFEKPINGGEKFGYSERGRNYSNDKDNGGLKFCVGDKVRHKIFGDGVVKEIDYGNECYEIYFNYAKKELSISFTAKMIKLD